MEYTNAKIEAPTHLRLRAAQAALAIELQRSLTISEAIDLLIERSKRASKSERKTMLYASGK